MFVYDVYDLNGDWVFDTRSEIQATIGARRYGGRFVRRLIRK